MRQCKSRPGGQGGTKLFNGAIDVVAIGEQGESQIVSRQCRLGTASDGDLKFRQGASEILLQPANLAQIIVSFTITWVVTERPTKRSCGVLQLAFISKRNPPVALPFCPQQNQLAA